MRTTNKSGQSSNFGQIGPRDAELQPLINVRNWFLLNILRMDGQNLTKFCIPIITDMIYVATVRRYFLQICNGVTALDWCQKLVFAQYLENGWTEFNQILYTHDHWQDLYWYCKAIFFGKCSTELQPLIDVRNWFLLNILRMDGQNLTKFCIHFIIYMIYVCFVNCQFFANLQQSYGPWLISEIFFCSISVRMDGQNLTKFCIHIIIDKIYVGKVKSHFSQICNGVMALDWCQKFVFAQYFDNEYTEFNLIMNIQNLTKFCIYITIDMIYPPSVLLTVLCSWTYLCSLIVLWRGYGQILWQF